MKKITSVTMHTTSEGQRLSFTYSVIDEGSGLLVSDNNRARVLVMDIVANTDVLAAINTVMSYATNKIGD